MIEAAATTKGSGKAGKPGETTAAEGKAQSAGREAQDGADGLTSEGVARLLSSEFADEAEERSGAEAVPGPEAADTTREEEVEQPRDEGTKGEEEVNAEGAEKAAEKTEGTEAEAEGHEEAETLPAELQSAIESWEQAGGGELPPVLQKLVERRIGKLTSAREQEKAAREAAERRAQSAEAEAEALRNDPQRPAGARPDAVPDLKRLDKIEGVARRIVEDAENFLDGTSSEAEEARVRRFMESERLDEKGLKRRVRELNGIIAGIPAERAKGQQFLADRAKLEPIVKEQFPWMDDKASPQYQKARAVLDSIPNYMELTPAARIGLGVYVLGLEEFEKRMAGKGGKGDGKGGERRTSNSELPTLNGGTGKETKAPPKTPARVGSAARAAVNGGNRAEEAARQKFESAPSYESVVELLKIGLRS